MDIVSMVQTGKSISQGKRFLVAPLDWGLGHATRCIPIIKVLLDSGHEVVLAAAGQTARVLSGEFPQLKVVPILNYNMRYSSSALLLALKFPFMVAKVFWCAWLEHRQLERLIKREAIDVVLSDQRFGCHSRRAYSIYLSHQLCVKMPKGFGLVEKLVWRGLTHAASQFTTLWIPDYPGEESLTGDLTHKYPIRASHEFVGPLSRFALNNKGPHERPVDLLVLLSGPEPQRTIFEKNILAQLESFPGNATVLLGKPGGEVPQRVSPTITIHTHLETERLQKILNSAQAIICRGGYSTIMDLVVLGKKAVLVPTPGQTEQEYLCERLADQGRFVMQKQKYLDIHKALADLEALEAIKAATNPGAILREAVKKACKEL